MNIRVEDTGACRKTVHVEVPADEVTSEMEEVLQGYAKVARIPGFRPGRAPRELIRRRYAKDITQEVKDRLIPRGYQQAVQKQKLKTVAVLDVKDQPVEPGQPFAFSVLLDVAPDFELPNFKGLEIEGKTISVSDQDVDETLQRIRDGSGRYEDVTGRPVQKSDLVQIDYEGVLDGHPIEELSPSSAGLGKGKDFWMIADNENSFLPGFGEGLIGASVGEKRQVFVDFPADFPAPAVAGKKATYFADVKAIREKRPAELNEAFLTSMQAESVDALRERIRADLKLMREAAETRRQTGEVARILLQNTRLDVPESVVAQETRNEVYDIVQHNTQSGVDQAEIENRKEEIFENATRTATDRVKLRYILRRIAEAEQVEVTRAELDARIARLAQQHRLTPDRVRADLEKNEALAKLEDEIRLNKTLDLVRQQAKVTLK